MYNSRPLRSLVLMCFALAVTAGYAPPSIATEQRVALVVGNSDYPSARLRNPVNDANAMAAKLRTLGFDVILRTDANQRDMSRAISEFGKKLKLGSIGLFYFAGHGMQVRGKNFLIPVDAEIETEGSVRGEAVDVEHVLDQLGAAQLSLVILDACRNNPFETRFRRAGSGGLAQIDAPTGSLLAYATAPGKVASDGAGSNGLYTSALLRAMDVPGLKIEDLFKQVRNEVIKESENQQIPWESSSLTAEFYFRPGLKVEIDSARLQQADKEKAELLKQVEKLRMELASLKPAPVAAKQVPAEAAATSAVTAKPAEIASLPISAMPAATINTAAAASSSDASWPQRLALLDKLRGKLTYSKAIAILLDISTQEDLALVIALEKHLLGARWASAYAIGVTDSGKPYWASADGYRIPAFAVDTTLEFCAKNVHRTCSVIVQNNQFREKEFFEFANQLSRLDAANARQAYLQGLSKPPIQTETPGGQGARGGSSPGSVNAARIFTPAAE